METIYADEATEVAYLPGTNGTAVVSFTGVGMGLGAVQTEEFRKSLNGTPDVVFFVKDKTRHWYNESFNLIVDILNTKLRSLQTRRTITLGNSMGGWAMAFAAKLHNCQRAIAFSTQTTVDPAIVPWEHRYDRWCHDVVRWHGLDSTTMLHEDIR